MKKIGRTGEWVVMVATLLGLMEALMWMETRHEAQSSPDVQLKVFPRVLTSTLDGPIGVTSGIEQRGLAGSSSVSGGPAAVGAGGMFDTTSGRSGTANDAGSRPVPSSAGDCPSFAERTYMNAKVLAERETDNTDGTRTQVRLLLTTRKYPLARVEETRRLDPNSGKETVVNRSELVADNIIVRLRDGMTEENLRELCGKHGAAILRKLRVPGPGTYLVALPRVKAAALTPGLAATGLDAAPEAVTAFAAESQAVAYAEPNGIVYALGVVPNDPSFNKCWGLNNSGQTGGTPGADIEAVDAWAFAKGNRNVVVGVIDTGTDYDHPDLRSNMWMNVGETGLDTQGHDKRSNGIDDDGNGYVDDWRGWNFVSDNNDPRDDVFHGTHCSGTIGAVGNNGLGVAGVCWNVSIMPLKFLGADGSGSTDGAAEAIAYATRMHADLTSNSWGPRGGGGESKVLYDAVAEANAAGSLFVVAAGNDGVDHETTHYYPADYDISNIVVVAATDSKDQLALFSCYGATNVDLAAPGVAIYSTFPTYMTDLMGQYGLSTNYGTISGTSMATPHVAGVCALLKSLAPGFTAFQIKARVLGQTDPVAVLTGKCLTGGRLNAYKTILISEKPMVLFNAFAMSDVAGNGDGVINPGESVNLTVTLQNLGIGTATGVTATVSTSDVYVAVTDGTSAFGNIAGYGGIRAASDPVGLAISGTCPTPHTATINLVIAASGGQSWTDHFDVVVYTSSQISGGVTLDGVQLSGATITYSGPLSGTALSVGNGQYLFGGIDGSYVLVAQKADYLATLPALVTVPPSTSGVNFAFTTASISGRVTDADSGLPVSGATVEYAGAVTGSVTTAADGRYAISRVFGQTATLTLTARKTGVYFVSAPTNVVAPPGAAGVDFQLGVSDIHVTPGSLSATVVVGGVATQTLRIANNGSAILTWSTHKTMSQLPGLQAGQVRRVLFAPYRDDIPWSLSDGSNTMQSTYQLYPWGVAFDGEALWTMEFYTAIDPSKYVRRLYRLDPLDGHVTRIVELLPRDYETPCGLAWDGVKFWLGDFHNGDLFTADRSTGLIREKSFVTGIKDESYLTGVAYGDGALWVSDFYGVGIWKHNPKTGQQLAKLPSPSSSPLYALAHFNGALWAAPCNDTKIYKLNPDTGAVISSFEGPVSSDALKQGLGYGGDGGLWLSTWDSTGGCRIYLVDTGEADWLKLSPELGIVNPHSYLDVVVTMDSTTLPTSGVCTATIYVDSDDPDTPQAAVPVTFTVTPGSNTPPVITAGPTAGPNPAAIGQTVNFAATASDANGDPLTYRWDFCDGTTASGASVAHAFAFDDVFTVKLTVTDGKGGRTSKVVKVTVPPRTWTVTVSKIGTDLMGMVYPSGATSVREGQNCSVIISAGSGCEIADLVIDGVSRGPEPPHCTYQFYNVSTNHTMVAVFEKTKYTVAASAGPGGSITPSGALRLNLYDSTNFDIVADSGYQIADIKIDGVSTNKNFGGTPRFFYYMFVDTNHTIEAFFCPATNPAAAAFVGEDATTQGSWKGKYGRDGWFVPYTGANSESDPAYLTGGVNYVWGWSPKVWASSTADVRGLQRPDPDTDRIAACRLSNPFTFIDLNLTDGSLHRVALYCLDWTNECDQQRVEAVDYASGRVLASHTLQSFRGGKYLVWNLRGHVVLRVVSLLQYPLCARTSGLFFDPPDSSNHPPVSVDGSARTRAGRPVRVTLTATDADGDPLTYAIVGEAASGGTLSGLSANHVTYTPKAGFTGTDHFHFEAWDAQTNSALAQFTILVRPMPRIERFGAAGAGDLGLWWSQATNGVYIDMSPTLTPTTQWQVVAGPLESVTNWAFVVPTDQTRGYYRIRAP